MGIGRAGLVCLYEQMSHLSLVLVYAIVLDKVIGVSWWVKTVKGHRLVRVGRQKVN